MSFSSLLNRDCIVGTPVYGAEDAHGQPAVSYSPITVRCRIQPASGRELRSNNNQKVIAEYNVFLPAGTVVSEKSVLTISGVSYNILLVQPFDAFSESHHIECGVETLRK